MSAPIILPCSSYRIDSHVINQAIYVSLQVQGAMAALTLTGPEVPDVLIRLERDAFSCKMSDPQEKGDQVIMALDVNLVRPTTSVATLFWNRTDKDRASFPRLMLLFDQNGEMWSGKKYRAFVESVKPNFPGESWEYLGAKQSTTVWARDSTIILAQTMIAGNIEMELSDLKKLEQGYWINDQIVDFALSKTVADVRVQNGSAMDFIWLASSFFLTKLRNDGAENTSRWLPELSPRFAFWIIPAFNEKRKHWYLLVVVNAYQSMIEETMEGCFVVVLDSLYDKMPSEDEAAIMSIFQYARNIRGLASIKLPKVIYPKVIKQTNGDDCGIYTIHFGRLWIMDGKKLWHMILNGSDVEVGINNVWKHSEVANLRKELQCEILKSAEEGWFLRQS